MKRILNEKELGDWIFHQVQVLGNRCDGIRGIVDGEEVNVGWKNVVSGEVIEVVYGEEGG